MKKLLFAAYDLGIGGIETALATLLDEIADKYEVTLVLEHAQGEFLSRIPKKVKIIEFTPSNNKNVFVRKTINFFKQLFFRLRFEHRFDFAACYATFSLPSSFVARTASKNSVLWVHNDYLNFYNNDIAKYKKFFRDLKINEFKKIVFVSSLDKKIFTAQFPQYIKKCVTCNNLIDYKSIIKKSKESVDDFEKENIITFINVGRHDEHQKRISRLINATEKLHNEGYKFRVVLVGKGTNTSQYVRMAQKAKNIIFLGPKQNPYPYMKNSDCLVLSSQFEGYPVVFVEAQILGIPIVTTDVSDAKEDIKDNYGIVTENSEEGVYRGMKEFLDYGFTPKEFDPKKYNQDILMELEKLI